MWWHADRHSAQRNSQVCYIWQATGSWLIVTLNALSKAGEKDLKVRPYSDTIPTESVTQIKGVASSIKIWSSSLLQQDHTSSNKATPPESTTPYDFMGTKHIQTTI